jgi:hypothetical protein
MLFVSNEVFNYFLSKFIRPFCVRSHNPSPGQSRWNLKGEFTSWWYQIRTTGASGGRNLVIGSNFKKRAAYTYYSYAVSEVNSNFFTCSVKLNRTCLAEFAKEGGWRLHILQEHLVDRSHERKGFRTNMCRWTKSSQFARSSHPSRSAL